MVIRARMPSYHRVNLDCPCGVLPGRASPTDTSMSRSGGTERVEGEGISLAPDSFTRRRVANKRSLGMPLLAGGTAWMMKGGGGGGIE